MGIIRRVEYLFWTTHEINCALEVLQVIRFLKGLNSIVEISHVLVGGFSRRGASDCRLRYSESNRFMNEDTQRI